METERDQWLLRAGKWGAEEWGVTANDSRFEDDENFLKLDYDDDCTTV